MKFRTLASARSRRALAAAAQRVYEAWRPPRRDPNAPGICDKIADAVAAVLRAKGVEALPAACTFEQLATAKSRAKYRWANETWGVEHVTVAARVDDCVADIDVPAEVYERARRFTKGLKWGKGYARVKGAKIRPEHVRVVCVSRNPEDFARYMPDAPQDPTWEDDD